MIGLTGRDIVLLVTCIVVSTSLARAGEPTPSEREAMYYRYLEFPSYVKGGSIEPHWMADGSSFWYAEGAPDNTVIWKVDPNANTKTALFDTARLRQALTDLLGHESPYNGVPFKEFAFVEGEKAVKFTVKDREFSLQLGTYTITPLPLQSEEERTRRIPQVVWRDVAGRSRLWEVLSPDSSWFAGVRDNNLWLRATNEDRSVQMTVDGIEDYGWSVAGAKWSPDGSKLALQKRDYREVPKIPIVHWLKPTVDVEWVPMRSGFSRTKAGGPLPKAELYVIDVETGQQVRVDTGEEPDQHLFSVTWRRDGSELLFLRASRTFNKLDLMGADPNTGATRVILTETQETFVGQYMFSELEESKGFMWMSERDGWNHVYLYDMAGNLIRRLTEGEFPVLRIEAVDEKGGWVYFTAHAEKRLYDTHLYRVNLEGRGFTRLTEGTGQHAIRFAPSQQFFLDTHSSIDRPPTVELRRADGTLLQTLSRANIDALREELKWSPPEEFVVKAADGKTDLYGVLYKPYDFDRERKYPVIEYIYAGPQLSDVQRTFMNDYAIYPQALAQLGFVVFVVDGRGTPGRSKAFQDVAYGNLGRHEIADHMAALMQLAGRRPYMDLDRVGIFGHSYGGYMTLRALLLAPDVYHVGVAISPVVDLYFGNFTEIYMGLPEDNKEGYEYASNLPLVERLQGKLLVIHGTSDFSAVFSGTMKLVEALIQAGKPIDMLVLPERDHVIDVASIIVEKDNRYVGEAIRRYFQEHLKP